MTKQFLNPPGLSQPPSYRQVVMASGGTLVFVSGQVALDAQSQLIGSGDLRTQTRQVFENLKTALAAAGASFADVVKITTYIVNYTPADREVLAEVRGRYLSNENPPASTLIGVQALAREDFLIEIEATAVVE
ncbi:MAG: RidA family protein [Dehalococcoidia bacterium]